MTGKANQEELNGKAVDGMEKVTWGAILKNVALAMNK